MNTNKEYTKNLNNKIITDEMLELVLYSINKRAKNWRDKKNEYYQKNKNMSWNRYYAFDKYSNIDKCKEEEHKYYEQKDYLLNTLLQPKCIHRVQESFFLFYETTNYSFHNPIDNIDGYNLEIVTINNLQTFGKEIIQLASTQFCSKLIELVKSGEYKYLSTMKVAC